LPSRRRWARAAVDRISPPEDSDADELWHEDDNENGPEWDGVIAALHARLGGS
jgi:hypothetical protein